MALEMMMLQGVPPLPPAPPGIPTTSMPPMPTGVGMPGINIPSSVALVPIAFFVAVVVIILGLAVIRAWSRRAERHAMPDAIPADLGERLTRIEQAIDAMAIEVERISEGQRFTTKLLSERQPVPVEGERSR